MNNEILQDPKTMVSEFGFNADQLQDILLRIKHIRAEGGFGVVNVIMKGGYVYKIEHTVQGKPTVFKREGCVENDQTD